MAPSPSSFKVRIDTILGPTQLELSQLDISSWTAKVVGYDSTMADGNSKEDAIRQAITLYLHVKIGQIRRGNWMPRYLKDS